MPDPPHAVPSRGSSLRVARIGPARRSLRRRASAQTAAGVCTSARSPRSARPSRAGRRRLTRFARSPARTKRSCAVSDQRLLRQRALAGGRPVASARSSMSGEVKDRDRRRTVLAWLQARVSAQPARRSTAAAQSGGAGVAAGLPPASPASPRAGRPDRRSQPARPPSSSGHHAVSVAARRPGHHRARPKRSSFTGERVVESGSHLFRFHERGDRQVRSPSGSARSRAR